MARKEQANPQLDMTPMIDVVFELIIFFVVTIKQDDIFSKLNANRPAPNKSAAASEEKDTSIKIEIGNEKPYWVKDKEGKRVLRDWFVLNGRPFREEEFKNNIQMLAKTSKDSLVLVQCTLGSPHRKLVKALDACHGNKLFNLSIFSM